MPKYGEGKGGISWPTRHTPRCPACTISQSTGQATTRRRRRSRSRSALAGFSSRAMRDRRSSVLRPDKRPKTRPTKSGSFCRRAGNSRSPRSPSRSRAARRRSSAVAHAPPARATTFRWMEHSSAASAANRCSSSGEGHWSNVLRIRTD